MAKPESWRLDVASYPFQAAIPTRWADLDLLGHINNVSMAGLFAGASTARLNCIMATAASAG
jgi:acyl-CoA thioester hydrolase